MNKTIYYRIESNKVILFDWSTRSYFQLPHTEIDKIKSDLCALGYSNNYVLAERKMCESYRNEKSDHPASPLAVYIEIASSCNMKCMHCFKQHIPYLNTLGIKDLYRIIDELNKMGVFELRFVGYEPTTERELLKFIEYARSKMFYIVLNTNGFYSDIKQNELVSLGINEFLVSIDGNESYHDNLRTSGSYKRALSLISKLGDRKIRTKINMTVNKENIKYISHVARVASLNSVNFNVIPMRMIGNGERSMGESLALSPFLMLEIAQIVEQLRVEISNIVIYLTYHDYLSDVNAIQYHKSIYCDPCPAANNLNIMNNGQVYPCDLMSNLGDEFCLGSLFETSLFDIWRKNERMSHYRNLTKDEKCKDCKEYMLRCSGGCFIERYLYNNRKFQDPLCYIHLLENRCEQGDSNTQIDRGSFYDEDYYMHGVETKKSLYTNYRYIPERSNNDAEAIMQITEIEQGDTVIDYGSGMGFLMQAFDGKGIHAYGVEVSQYASNKSFKKQKIPKCIVLLFPARCDLISCGSDVNETQGIEKIS